MDDDPATSCPLIIPGGSARRVVLAALLALAASTCGAPDGTSAAGGDATASEVSAGAQAGAGAIRNGVPDGFPLPPGAGRSGSVGGEGTALSPFVVTFELSDRDGAAVTAWLREALPASGFRIIDDHATTSVASEYEQVASWALQKEGTGVVTHLLVREYPDGTNWLVLRSFSM